MAQSSRTRRCIRLSQSSLIDHSILVNALQHHATNNTNGAVDKVPYVIAVQKVSILTRWDIHSVLSRLTMPVFMVHVLKQPADRSWHGGPMYPLAIAHWIASNAGVLQSVNGRPDYGTRVNNPNIKTSCAQNTWSLCQTACWKFHHSTVCLGDLLPA